MEFQDLQKKALEVKSLYQEYNKAAGEKDWSANEYASGFVGDVGDLVKLVMAKEGFRSIENVDGKIQHELDDCLWSLFVLADQLGVNLENSFNSTMTELEARLKK